MNIVKKIPNIGLLVFFGFIVLIFSIASPTFRSLDNVETLLSGFSHIAIMAIGQSFVILLGGIDLSVGAIMALVGMVVFDLIVIFDVPASVAAFCGLITGNLCGLMNGLLITKLRLQPFIATLATMIIYRGVVYAISGRQLFPQLSTKAIESDFYLQIDGYFESLEIIPYVFAYMLILLVITSILLKKNSLGKAIYSVGGNEEAARLSGINIHRINHIAYSMSGFCAGLAALVMTSRLNTATENLGIGIELSVIAATVIGGVKLIGGQGNTFGPVIAAFLMGTILIGLTLVGVSTYAQPVVAGFLLLITVSYDKIVRQSTAFIKKLR